MKKFREYLSEEIKIGALASGGIEVERDAVRDEINGILAGIASKPCVTPYGSLNKIRKALSYFSIFLPKRVYLEGRHGVEVWEVNQFGDKMGMTDQGEFIKSVPAKFYLFFHYHLIGSMYYLEAKIVDEKELEQKVNMTERMFAEELDAEARQKLAKAAAPKEKQHTALGDCDCSQGDSPSTKQAVDVSMRKKDKKLSADKLDESGRILRSVNDKDEDPQPTPAYAKRIEQEKHDKQRKKINRANAVHMKMYMRTGDKKWLHGMKEETLDEVSGATLGSYIVKSKKDEKARRQKGIETRDEIRKQTGMMVGTPIDRKLHSSKASRSAGQELAMKKLTGKAKVAANEETLDELNKSTYVSYIKKASHDVGTQSAATGRYGDRANKALAKYKKGGDYTDWQEHEKNSKVADKAFNKSWKRREGIAKASDRLMKEDNLDEVSKETLARYIPKAAHSVGLIAARRASKVGRDISHMDTPEYAKSEKKQTMRHRGIERAAEKLAKEDVQLDELSKDTLARYAIKAHRRGDMARQMSDGGKNKDMDKYANKRYKGVQTAIKKMWDMKEEQIDELSKETLKSYREKVASKHLPGTDAKSFVHTRGHTTAGRKLGMSALDSTLDTITKRFSPKYVKNLSDKVEKARDADPGFQAYKERKAKKD